ncbi:hypothetical protein QZH41_015793 [Actinostola sp. cb2023]|nr:hypothetical protein QZH41_015793 [Actinostola sp. cb2023]
MYIHDIKVGTTISHGEPSILKESPATALVDGNNLLGPVVGNFCMDLAIKKAQDIGISWVACRGSNHYGIAGWYTLRAMERGLIGISVTNTSPLVVPTRAREIEMNKRKNEPIPPGWGVDNKGLETLDPNEVLSSGGQLPLGGTEQTSGYKGYGLGMLVEVLSGVLAGSAIGPDIRRWKGDDRVANLGQCFGVINPAMFEPGYKDRMQHLMDYHRILKPAEGEKSVLVAGDPERHHMRKVEKENGILYHVNLLSSLVSTTGSPTHRQPNPQAAQP